MLKKLAQSFRFLSFIVYADHASMHKAFKAIEPLIPQNDLIKLFDLWQESQEGESGSAQDLEDLGDEILENVAGELSEVQWDILAQNIDAIVRDARNAQPESDPIPTEVKEQEILQQGLTFKSPGHKTKEEERAKNLKRIRTLAELKKRSDFNELVKNVQNENFEGLEQAEVTAIKYYIYRHINRAEEINRQDYNVSKLQKQFGLSREQAKEKFKELKQINSLNISPEKIQDIQKRYNISEQEAIDMINKSISEKSHGFESINFGNKKIVPLSRLEYSRLEYAEKIYRNKLIADGKSPEDAKTVAKTLFKEFKNNIRFENNKAKLIDDFLNKVKNA